MDDELNQMRSLVLRHAHGRLNRTPIPRVSIATGSMASRPMPTLYEAMLCIVLQGAKEVMIGDRLLRYDTASYFVASIEVPASGRVVQASPEKPYIAVSLALDCGALAALLPETPPRPEDQAEGFGIGPMTPELLDPWLRLLRLLDAPQDIKALAPLLECEILYRLLQGPQGGVLRQVTRSDSRLSQIREAIGWIRTHYDQPLRIETLSSIAGMSAATFHRHFKAATALSPLQYQKNLRLQQARRLLIAQEDAARAAYAVGYESASQFSREYARQFGVSPGRDAERLRGSHPAVWDDANVSG